MNEPARPRSADRPSRGRGRPAHIGRDKVLEASLSLARTEGFGSLSMAAVARRLGSSPMALYRYVADRDGLLRLVADAALGEIALPDEPWLDPVDRLGELMRRNRAVLLRYPGLATFFYSQQPIFGGGPNAARLADASFGYLFAAGFHGTEAALAFASTRYLSAIGLLELTDHRTPHGGLATAGLGRALEHVTADQLPSLRLAADSLVALDPEAQFDYGLTMAMDGLRTKLARG